MISPPNSALKLTDKEIAYLQTQRLPRIATASAEAQPDVVQVGFEFDGEYFYVGGHDLPKTVKYRNVQINPKVALVVDDLQSIRPWRPREPQGPRHGGLDHAAGLRGRRHLHPHQTADEAELGH